MKISTKYFLAVIFVLFVFSGLSSSIEGQTVSKIDKAVAVKEIIKPQFINFNEIKYSGTISTQYNQSGTVIKRGVYLAYHYGDLSDPKKWLTDALKLFFNGVEITKKMEPNYFFDRQVSSLTRNLDVVIKHKTNILSNVFSASGISTPVSMTFPTQGYVYELGSNQLNTKKVGLKVTWTPTNDDILVWLYHKGIVINKLTSSPGTNYVIFNHSLFQSGENYTIRIFHEGPSLILAGKFKTPSSIRNTYLIWCNIKTGSR